MSFVASINTFDSDGNNVFTHNEPIRVALTLDEPTTGLTLSDIELPDGLSIVENSVNYISYTSNGNLEVLLEIRFMVQVAEGINSTDNRIKISADSYSFLTDISSFTIQSDSFGIDSVDPTLTISMEGDMSQPLGDGQSVKVIFSFSEPVVNFDASKIIVSADSGTISQFETESSSRYTAVFTPNPGTYMTDSAISVNVGAYSDVNSNYNTSASSVNFAIDAREFVSPSPTIHIPSNLLVTGPLDFTVSFNETVKGFDAMDVSVSAGTVELIGADTAAKLFSFRYSPDVALGQDGENVSITILGNGYTDLSGNDGLGSTPVNFVVDVVSPKPMVSLEDIALPGGSDKRVTFTFLEPVADFGLDDVLISESVGSLHDFQPEGVDGKVYSAIFTPNLNIEKSGIKILVDGAYADIAGNAGQYAESSAFNVDTLRPSVMITAGEPLDTQLSMDESLTLTFAFTEAVSNFNLSDVSLSEAVGSLDDFVQIDAAGKTYAVTFTPTSGIEKSGISLTLSGDYTDLAGNTGLSYPSVSFDIDTVAPTLHIATSDTNLTRGESLMLTFTFTEAVTNFSADDVRLDGAAVSLSAFTETVPGRTFTAIYTPPAETIDSINIFSVAKGSYTDLFGNQGAAANSANVSVDTVGNQIFGTDGRDFLIGTAGADRISGVPKSSEDTGKGVADFLSGLGGADIFVLGNSSKAFYDDGKDNPSGKRDVATIMDFSHSDGDKIEVKTGTYFFSELSIGKIAGAGLYLDTNNSGSWDAKDELIGFLVGVAPDSVSVTQDLIQV